MTDLTSAPAGVAPSPNGYFRLAVPLAQALIRNTRAAMRPKDALLLMAVHAHIAQLPLDELQRTPASGSQMASVIASVRLADVLQSLGYKRRNGDFASSAWRRARLAIARLAKAPCRVPFKVRTGRRGLLADKSFFQPLIVPVTGIGEPLAVKLNAYSPPDDRYFILVPRRLLLLRNILTNVSTRLALWLLIRHRGRRVDGRVKHGWSVVVTSEALTQAGLIDSDKAKQRFELARWRRGFELLERVGVVRIVGDCWPFKVELSSTLFHPDGAS